MVTLLLVATFLMTFTVAIHSVGIALALRVLTASTAALPTRLWPMALLLVRVAAWLIAISLVEILVWGLAYVWLQCLPDAESALYFSGVTYTSIGYGDLVLSKQWRMLAPVQGLTGILMSGLSAGLFFAMASKIYRARLP